MIRAAWSSILFHKSIRQLDMFNAPYFYKYFFHTLQPHIAKVFSSTQDWSSSISDVKVAPSIMEASQIQFTVSYCGLPSKWEFFIKMRAAFPASILPRVMQEGESKEGSSHFDEKLSIW